MEPIEHTGGFGDLLPRIRLFRDDLERIVDIMKDAGLEITITDSTHKYSDFDDVKGNRGSRIRQLKVQGAPSEDLLNKQPALKSWDSLSVEFRSDDKTWLWVSQPGPPLEVYWHRVRDLILGCRRWHEKALNPWVGWFTLSALCAFLSVGLAIPHPFRQAFAITVGSLLGISLVYCLLSLYWRLTYPVLILDRGHEWQSFWRRNGDKIILAFLSGVIGGVIGWFIKK
jgi:hypothetical protein